MSKPSVCYTPLPGITPEAEVGALSNALRFILDCHAKKILASIRDLYARRPETRDLEAWELQSLLWSLGYTDCLAPEASIEAAMKVARDDHGRDEGAA